MSERSRFRTPFGSQRVNESQSVLKAARHFFFTIVPLIPDKFSCIELLLVRFEILGLLVNTMNPHDKISRRNRVNFAQQFQMQLSQQPKPISQFFFVFPKSTSNYEYFFKKEKSHSLRIFEITDSE